MSLPLASRIVRGSLGIACAAAMALATAGCGGTPSRMPEGQPVRGLVTLKGKPLTGVTLTLQDGERGLGASCVVDDQGRFDSGSPLPAGRYRVAFATVLAPFEPESATGGPAAPAPPPVPPKLPASLPRKYHQIGTSDLVVEVKGDGSELEVRVPG